MSVSEKKFLSAGTAAAAATQESETERAGSDGSTGARALVRPTLWRAMRLKGSLCAVGAAAALALLLTLPAAPASADCGSTVEQGSYDPDTNTFTPGTAATDDDIRVTCTESGTDGDDVITFDSLDTDAITAPGRIRDRIVHRREPQRHGPVLAKTPTSQTSTGSSRPAASRPPDHWWMAGRWRSLVQRLSRYGPAILFMARGPRGDHDQRGRSARRAIDVERGTTGARPRLSTGERSTPTAAWIPAARQDRQTAVQSAIFRRLPPRAQPRVTNYGHVETRG